MFDAAGRWLSRPLSPSILFLLVPIFCLLPALIIAGPLLHYHIQADDYYHFGASRTLDRTLSNLVRPHNLHVVAFFRLVNWAAFVAAGDWESLPRVASIIAYLLLAANMVVCGRLVRLELGSESIGLASMVGLGGSTLLYSAVTFYAATPALWAGLGVLLTVYCLARWRRSGGFGAMIAAGASSLLAIASWSGGYVVVPVAWAYLWADGRRPCRRAAWLFFVASGSAAGLLFLFARQSILSAQNLGGRPPAQAMNPLRGIVHTIHAIPESLMLRNLGVDAEIEESQAAVLCLVVAGFWFWLFRRTPAVHPLVAAGAACAIVSYLLIYTARGYLPFSSLRTTPWYQTLPHFGAILFVCGLLHGRCVSGSARPITARGILGAALFSVLFLTAQKPIADRLFQNETLPGLHRARFNGFATPEGFIEFVSWHVAENAAAEQRRVLARLDRIETICWQLGISDQALRDLFGSPRFPGLPVELNPWQILNLPRHSVADRNTVNHSLGWVVEEHEVTHLALRPLLESLEAPDPPTRTAAVISLGLLGPAAEPALKPIMERLSDPSPITRMHAASAIKQIDPGTAAKLGLN